MVPHDGLPWLLSQAEAGKGSSQPMQARISKWKRCDACEQTLPIPTYFGDSDKELEETHTLPLGGQQRGIYCFSPLQELFFFFSSLFLWQPLVFLLLHYFALLQQKGQDGI